MKLSDATYDEDNNIVPSENTQSASRGITQNIEDSESVIPTFLSRLGITDESLSFATGRVAGELVKFYDSIPKNERNSESIKRFHNDELVTLQNSISRIILEETSKVIDPSRISPKALESVLIEFADSNESIYDLPIGTRLVEVVPQGTSDSSAISSTSGTSRGISDSSKFALRANSRSLQDSLSITSSQTTSEAKDSDTVSLGSSVSESSDSENVSLSQVSGTVEDSSELVSGSSSSLRQEDSFEITANQSSLSSEDSSEVFTNSTKARAEDSSEISTSSTQSSSEDSSEISTESAQTRIEDSSEITGNESSSTGQKDSSSIKFENPEEPTEDNNPFELFGKDISNEFDKFELEWKSYGEMAEKTWQNITSVDNWAQSTVSVATPLTKSILESGLYLFSSVRGSEAARMISDIPAFAAGVINYTVTDPMTRSVGRIATSIQRLFSVPDRFLSSATEFLRGKVSSAIRGVEDFVTNPIDRLSTSLESRITRLFEGPGVQFVSSASKAEFDKAMFNIDEPSEVKNDSVTISIGGTSESTPGLVSTTNVSSTSKAETGYVLNFDGEVSNKVSSDSISFGNTTSVVEANDNIPFKKPITPGQKLEGRSERKKAKQSPETEDLSLEFSELSSSNAESSDKVNPDDSKISSIPSNEYSVNLNSKISSIPSSEYSVNFEESKIGQIPRDEFSIVYTNKTSPAPPYTRQDLMNITDCQFSVDSFWNITLTPHVYGKDKPPELFKGRTLPVMSFRLIGESLSNSQTQSYPGVSMSYPSRYSSPSSVVISLPEVIIDNKLEIRTWVKNYLDYALCREENPKSIKYKDMRKCSYEMTIQKYGLSWTELWKKEYLVIPEVSEDLNGESSPSAEIMSISFNIIGENLE